MTHTRSWSLWAAIALLGLLGAALLALAPEPSSAQAPAGKAIPQLTLRGANEVPAVTTTAVGYFSGTLNTDSLTFDLSADGADFTMAHIHTGAAGVNGPVVAFLFGPNTVGQPSIHPTGTIRVANLVGPLANNWQGFADAMAKGELYVNAHSLKNPGGEIRVQIPATSVTPVATPRPPSTGNGSVGSGSGPSWMSYQILGALFVGIAGGGALLVASRRRNG